MISNTSRNILLVDDDEALRLILGEGLRQHDGFAIFEADTGAKALYLTKSEHFEAILLDVGLPDMNGCELCRIMRRKGVKSPIIMLTAADTEADTILGLDAGANDYVAKPFRIEVLLARLHAHLRQHETSDDAVYMIGPYTFRLGAKMLIHDETKRKVRLTEKETAILKHLYRSGGQVVGRDTLLTEVLNYSADASSHTIETHVYRLRQKIETDPSNPQILLMQPGGYQLTS